MFRVTQSALATAVVVIAGVGVASPAHAATTVTIDSSGVASPSTVTDSQVTVVNNYAQDIKFTGSTFQSGGTSCSSINCTVTAGGNATYEVSPFAMVGEYVVAYAVSPVGTQTPIGGAGGTLNLFVTYSSGGGGGGGGGGSSSSSSVSTGPAPIPQQFGLPASGTCDEAAPADLNWAGVPSGSWGISWAQWMNDGNGGAVCTRTLNYVGTGWTVN